MEDGLGQLLDIVAIGSAGVLLVPVGVLALECLMAVVGRREQGGSGEAARGAIAVLVPAHNEEGGLGGTLRTVVPQLRAGDRLIVVADNCTDGTAAVARESGATTVIERNDPVNRGKGFALDRGMQELKENPPAVVVMIDADCRVGEGAIEALARQVVETGRPAQAAYTMDCPAGASPRIAVSALAFIVKNVVRPLGLRRMGMPCLLTGTGMAFPYATIAAAPLASGNIVEDMQLGIDLAIAGQTPLACPAARVMGEVAGQTKATYTQRKRWEHGHLQTLVTAVPKLVVAAIKQMRVGLMALALELAVPPLALLVMALVGAMVATVLYAYFGGSRVPAIMIGCGIVGLVGSVLLAWGRFASDVIPARTLAAVPFYVVWKVPLYLSFLFKREKQWIRTERAIPPGEAIGAGGPR